MKRFIIIFSLALASLLRMAADTVKIDGIFYNLNETTLEAEVTYNEEVYTTGVNSYTGEVFVPNEVEYEGRTYAVTSIGENAFRWSENLTSVVLPDNVRTIKYNAFFAVQSLNSITFGKNISKLRGSPFWGCENLKSVDFYSVESLCSLLVSQRGNPASMVGRFTIRGKEVKDLVIPEGITTLNNYVFENCAEITSVTLPKSLKRIERGVFSGCKGIEAISIPDNVEVIRPDAFSGCENLKRVDFSSLANFFKVHMGSAGIPSYRLYAGEKEVTEVTIPDTISSVWMKMFSGCKSIKTLTIPRHVTTIEADGLKGCSPENLKFEDWDSYYRINLLFTAWLGGGGDSPNAYPFKHHLFVGGEEVTDVVLPEGLSQVKAGLFQNCNHILSVQIPKGVENINSGSFDGCESLKDIYCDTEVLPQVRGNNFAGVKLENVTLHVLPNLLEEARTTSPWKDFGNIVEWTPDGIAETTAVDGKQSTAIYDLSGRRVQTPTKGIYIRDGKKKAY